MALPGGLTVSVARRFKPPDDARPPGQVAEEERHARNSRRIWWAAVGLVLAVVGGLLVLRALMAT